MRTCALRRLACFAAAVLAAAPHAVAGSSPPAVIGLTQNEVSEFLGAPRGEMRRGARIVRIYSNGSVEFKDGRAVASNLLSDEEAAERRLRLAREEAARRAAATNVIATLPTVSPTVLPASSPATDASARFYRPFVRPSCPDSPRYNSIPVVFELAQWPPGLRNAYKESVQIPVETGQRRTTHDTLVYELRKYPDEMLEQTLRCIYMIRDIRKDENDDPAGLAFRTEGIVLEHTAYLHHEYAHQLNYLFVEDFPLKALSEQAGKYSGFGKRPALSARDLWERGFTSNYAMCNAAEDFAEFCSSLYLQPDAIFRAMKEHAKLRAKFDIVRPFIEGVKRRTTGDDAPMDEAYFSRFDRSRWKP